MKDFKALEYEIKQKKLQKIEQTTRNKNLIAEQIITTYRDKLIQSVEDEVVKCINDGGNSLFYDGLISNELEKICKSNYKSIERYTEDFNKLSDIVGIALVDEIENHGYYYCPYKDFEGYRYSYIFWNKKHFILKKITNLIEKFAIILMILILLLSMVLIKIGFSK